MSDAVSVQQNSNADKFLKLSYNIRGPLRIAIDTNISQLARIDRQIWNSTGEVMWGSTPVDTGFLAITERRPERHRQIAPLNAIYCLARRNLIELYLVRSVNLEIQKARKLHTDQLGEQGLDHGITYKETKLNCDRIRLTNSKVISGLGRQEEECSLLLNEAREVLSFFDGAQRNDGLHLCLAASLNIEVFFLTTDERTIKRVAQLREGQPRFLGNLRVISPVEFCALTGVDPIAPLYATGQAVGLEEER